MRTTSGRPPDQPSRARAELENPLKVQRAGEKRDKQQHCSHEALVRRSLLDTGSSSAREPATFSPAPAPFENLVRRCCVRVPTASTTVARYPTFRPTVAAGASFRGSVGRGGFQISRRRGGAIARSRDPGGRSFSGPLMGWKLHRAADWEAVVAAIRSRLSAARRTASCTGRVCVIAVHQPRPGVAMAALKASPVSLKKNGWGSYRDNQES